MKLGSLFDGSGGFPLAGELCGIEPVWASEIEPFPCRVTAQRFPKMKQLGDVTKINGAEVEKVDIITFGSPCQDLSIAGKQAGIHEGARSSLFFEAVRIIKEMRNATTNEFPRFAVWENVPGAFSSNGGEDFRAVLEALCEVNEDGGVSIPKPKKWNHAGCILGDGYSIAWRLYDAQFWGVPQRRKRIYLIADFRTERAGEILFKPESLRGHFTEGKTPWESIAGYVAGSAGGGCILCLNDQGGAVMDVSDKAMTLRAQEHGHQPVVIYDARGNGEGGVCPTLTGDHENRITDYTAIATYIQPTFGQFKEDSKAQALKASDGKRVDAGAVVLEPAKPPRKYIVRRLTPLECCRLQGFPDWWVDGAEGSDTAIYKMWGNGIALPCAFDVLNRIAEEYNAETV